MRDNSLSLPISTLTLITSLIQRTKIRYRIPGLASYYLARYHFPIWIRNNEKTNLFPRKMLLLRPLLDSSILSGSLLAMGLGDPYLLNIPGTSIATADLPIIYCKEPGPEFPKLNLLPARVADVPSSISKAQPNGSNKLPVISKESPLQ